ncbi:MAG: cation transporter [Oligoflexales bacterium]|nr:cation transporter [Oligoflexales bacterium]
MSFNHKHDGREKPSQDQSQLTRVFAIGISINLSFALLEVYYGWRSNSLALLADAGHNFSDVAGLALAWVATIIGRIRPNARHTYGWKRATVLSSFANAIILLVAMGALGWEAIGRLREPVTIEGMTIVVVAAIGMVINSLTAILLHSRASDLNVRGAFIHMVADAAVSGGVVVAGILFMIFGWTWLDPVVSILVAGVILFGTTHLLRQSLHLLFDGVPEHIDPIAVRKYLEKVLGVIEVHDLHIWAMSTTEVALTVHLVVPSGHPGDVFLREISDTLQKKFEIQHVTVQIESALFSDECVTIQSKFSKNS